MSVDIAVQRFRRRQEQLFTSEVLVTREVSEGEFDPETGLHDAAEAETVYEGPGLIRPIGGQGQGSDVEVGERELRLGDARGKFPHDTDVRKDDIVVVTVDRHDTEMAGRRFRVTDVLPDSWQVVRNTVLEEVTGGPVEEESS